MLRLTIANSECAPLGLSDIADSEKETWQEQDGTVCAYGCMWQGQYWMEFPHRVSYCFAPDSSEVIAFAHPDTSLAAVWDTYYRSVLPIALQVLGREALHASAIQTGPGIICFCASSETGKSTIGYGLSQRGYPLWADDAVVFEQQNGVILATSLPFAVRLRSASIDYFYHSQMSSEAAEQHSMIYPTADSAALAAVCILEQEQTATQSTPVEIWRISPIRAIPAVLTHAYCFSLSNPARKQRMLRNYAALVRQVPVFRVRFLTGLEHLPTILNQIETQIVNVLTDDALAAPLDLP